MNDTEKGQLAQSTVQCFTRVTGSLDNLPGLIKKVIKERVWERRSNYGKIIELRNLRELITLSPIQGWGQDPRKIEAVIKDDPEALSMYREAMKGVNQYDMPNNNVIRQETKQGNSRAYSIDRVKREAPELAEDVLSGKMSPNAALVKAGIRENRQIYIPREPKAAAEKLKEAFGEAFISKLIKYLNT